LLNILKDINHFCWLLANAFMKIFSLLMSCGLSLTGLLMSANLTLAKNNAGNNIHVDQSRQFPETRWANADHYIRVHVPQNSGAMTALRLQVTGNLKFDTNQVQVFDLAGRKMPVVVTETAYTGNDVPERSIYLTFSSPIASGKQFDIRISNVKKALISQPATYFLSAKLIGNDQERYVGEAYFRSY
jgi:Protein of unknown function (DUF2808)